ncbi:MAG: hypothetical protein KJZ52_12420 [Anaerolineales bacterium]|nr:hypothetical protein [Anaerolineales bacterium]
MRNKTTTVFFAMILLASCAAPTQQATVIPQTSEVSETSEVLTATPTQTPTSMPTSTTTPEPTKVNVPPFSPEVIAVLEKNGLSIAPEDLCLWEETEGATVQCLTLNPEKVPALKQTLSKLNNTIGWLNTWSVRAKKPGKYPTLASYEAMLASKPLQLAMDVGMVWHPDSVLPTAGVFRPASEWEIDGVRVGNNALIDTSQIGMEIVDWTEAQQEGGYIRMLAGAQMKQVLEPIGGMIVNGQQVYRVVIMMTDEFTRKDLLDNDGDGRDDDGILIPDLTLPVADNTRSWNQLMNWVGNVAQVIGKNPKTAVADDFYDYIEFTAGGKVVLNKKIMDKMAEGTEFFDAEPQ